MARDQISFDSFAVENLVCPDFEESTGPEVTLEQMESDLERIEKENPTFAAVFRRIVDKRRAQLKNVGPAPRADALR